MVFSPEENIEELKDAQPRLIVALFLGEAEGGETMQMLTDFSKKHNRTDLCNLNAIEVVQSNSKHSITSKPFLL